MQRKILHSWQKLILKFFNSNQRLREKGEPVQTNKIVHFLICFHTSKIELSSPFYWHLNRFRRICLKFRRVLEISLFLYLKFLDFNFHSLVFPPKPFQWIRFMKFKWVFVVRLRYSIHLVLSASWELVISISILGSQIIFRFSALT